jgi:hypothetical protein
MRLTQGVTPDSVAVFVLPVHLLAVSLRACGASAYFGLLAIRTSRYYGCYSRKYAVVSFLRGGAVLRRGLRR